MAWGSISLFAGFLEKENSLETLIVIFENVSPKGFFWLNMKNFEISVLTANSRYLQTAARKISEVQVRVIIIGRGCLVLLKFKFKLCKDYVPWVLNFLVLIRHPCVLKNNYPSNIRTRNIRGLFLEKSLTVLLSV